MKQEDIKEMIEEVHILYDEITRIVQRIDELQKKSSEKEIKPNPIKSLISFEVQDQRLETHSTLIFSEINKILNNQNPDINIHDKDEWFKYSFIRVTEVFDGGIKYTRLISKSSEIKTAKIPQHMNGFFLKNQAYLIKYPSARIIVNSPIEWALTDSEDLLRRSARCFVSIFSALKSK
jgi:anaerobic ribonucleoside-triphosphate reductase